MTSVNDCPECQQMYNEFLGMFFVAGCGKHAKTKLSVEQLVSDQRAMLTALAAERDKLADRADRNERSLFALLAIRLAAQEVIDEYKGSSIDAPLTTTENLILALHSFDQMLESEAQS